MDPRRPRRWTDPLTGRSHASEGRLLAQMQQDHGPQLEAAGVTAQQAAFNHRNRHPWNRAHGSCAQTGRPTKWNEAAGRYDRFADGEATAEYRAQFLERMRRVHGKDHLLDDPGQQRAMLAGRRISGEVAWPDGARKQHVGRDEEALLEFLRDAGFPSHDVHSPAPMNIGYRDDRGVARVYIPDIYIASLDLIVESKRDNPHWRARDRGIERHKDEAARKSGHNFVKVEDGGTDALAEAVARLRGAPERAHSHRYGQQPGAQPLHESADHRGLTDAELRHEIEKAERGMRLYGELGSSETARTRGYEHRQLARALRSELARRARGAANESGVPLGDVLWDLGMQLARAEAALRAAVATGEKDKVASAKAARQGIRDRIRSADRAQAALLRHESVGGSTTAASDSPTETTEKAA